MATTAGDGSLDGVRAVVTGASSGIGEAIARALVAEGADVSLLARRRERLEELAAELPARAYPVDVGDPEAVRATIDRAAADLGGIDVLVNNAGVAINALAADADLADWHTMVDVNLGGVLNASHAAVPHLTAAAAGPRGVADVVTVSSASGRRVARPDQNVYAATKHAVTAFSEALRRELGPRHVRVGVVEPGFVVTEMTAHHDFTELEALLPEDVAASVVFMLTRPRRHAINAMLMRAPEQDS